MILLNILKGNNMSVIASIKSFRYHIGYYRLTKRFLKFGLPEITSEEKRIIRETWPGLHIYDMDFVHARVFKKIHGFSPFYLSPCWYNEIRAKMNPKDQLYALENKALCDVYFPQLRFPEVYVRRLNGYFFDKDMNFITEDVAIKILSAKKEFIIKPAIGSEQGDGVKKIKNTISTDWKSLFMEEGLNFIAQEVLKQAPEIEKLNPSSLNCFRVTTLWIDGKFGYSTALKVGKEGAFRDNWNCAYWVNVTDDGLLSEFGYDYNINAVSKTDNGIVFKGVQMPKYKEMIAHLKQMHKAIFPNCGVVGWDVTIDKDYNICIIEYNLWDPGTNIEQFVSGDFFRPFRDRMLNYINKK